MLNLKPAFAQYGNSLIKACVAVWLTCCNAVSAAPTTQQWVDQLASPDPANRDSAEMHLADMGRSAEDVLKIATGDNRPNVRQRATHALRQIRLFQLRGSDQALRIADVYLHGQGNSRKVALNNLFQIKPAANEVLTRLCSLEPDEDFRRSILFQLGTGYRDAAAALIADDQDATAMVALLNDASTMWGNRQAADDAMILNLTGKSDDQIDISTAEQINGDPDQQKHAAIRLCYLYRVSGKFDEALKYARMAREPSLIFLVLQDMGDWASAAKEPDDRWRDPLITNAVQAAFLRLAGDDTREMATISAGVAAALPDVDRSFIPSRFCLLDDLPQRGIELLTDQHPAVAFQMRVARHEISEAFKIAEKFKNHPLDAKELERLSHQLRQTLGELPLPANIEEISHPAVDLQWESAVQRLRDKDYSQAANSFAQMWARDHLHVDRLYLQGYSLEQAGEADRGRSLMHEAELIPLGDPEARHQLAKGLAAAGLNNAAQNQWQLALRSGGEWDELGFCNVYYAMLTDAVEQQQWKRASDIADRLCLLNLSPGLLLNPPEHLLNLPAQAHLMKARAALSTHDISATLREVQRYELYLPASSSMLIQIVPALDATGEHAHADELFNAAFSVLQEICRNYPRSVRYQNDLAWTSACCSRNLDAALTAAQTATQLNPNAWQQLDTLAEVHFRLGHRTEAVTIEKRAMTMTSDPYIARQVKRFENSVIPSTTQPQAEPR